MQTIATGNNYVVKFDANDRSGFPFFIFTSTGEGVVRLKYADQGVALTDGRAEMVDGKFQWVE